MADPARARKLAKRISQIVASAIEHEIKDERLAAVTVTDAKVTADLHDATVYYTVLGESVDAEPDYAGAAAALESAKGVLRTKVGRGTGVRYTPTLAFVADNIPGDVRKIEELLSKARQADAEAAKRAEGARHAGDENPYREPKDDESSDSSLEEAQPGSRD